MVLKFFKSTLPLVLASIIFIGILLWLKSFVGWASTPISFEINQMPLYTFLHNLLINNLFFYKLVGFIVMILCSLYLIQLNSKHILIKNRTYLPALIFILLTSSQNMLHGLNPAVFSAIFLAFTLNYIFGSYDIQKPYNNFFLSGFFVAIASLFYLPSVIFLLLVFISIIILRSFNFRNWIISIIGFITPWYFVFMYHFLVNDNLYAIPNLIEATWAQSKVDLPHGIIFYMFLGVSGLLLLISLLHLIGSLSTQKINVRKFHSILLWFTIISGILLSYSPTRSIEVIYIAAVPISFQTSLFLTFSRNRFWPEFFFVSLILVVGLMQFFTV